VPSSPEVERRRLARLARRAWSLKRTLDTRNETSQAFTLPSLLQVAGPDVAVRAVAWSEYVRTIEAELVAIQAEIDDTCFALYGIDAVDRIAISDGLGGSGAALEAKDDAGGPQDIAGREDSEGDGAAEEDGVAEIVSWAMGVALGRFDVRLATGARLAPSEPDPFAQLSACAPGILAGDDGMPFARPPADYPVTFPANGFLVQDPGHRRDVTTAVRAVIDVVFGVEADRWWADLGARLDPSGYDVSHWIASDFFEYHLRRHFKSHRKAPVFWQLGTPSGRYSLWLYAHRITRDIFFKLQNDLVGPKLAHEERRLSGLLQNAGGKPSASERKEISDQETLVEELREMLDEVKRIAPLWNPNLHDGVLLTIAPLWRLVPRLKSWQKDLKAQWDELVAGKYDWAHLAMHLWPERVVPKCAKDQSLAIAHGLADVFWVEGSDGKWMTRKMPTRSVDELVRERTSPAVKSALKSLLEADASGKSTGRRGRSPRRNASAAAVEGGEA
jgi:hypothetical protein